MMTETKQRISEFLSTGDESSSQTRSIAALRAEYDRARDAVVAASAHQKACLEALQGWCDHPSDCLVDAPGVEGIENWNGSPEFRVCRQCGLMEDGYMYEKLGRDVYDLPQVSREDASRMVLR